MSSRFGGGGGGKRGPKQQNGSFKVKHVKIRPQLEKPFLDATESKSKKQKRSTTTEVVELEESEDEEEFSYQQDLRPERKPLEGVIITITGVSEERSTLIAIAKELGAESNKSLSAKTTHLIAAMGGTEKYEVALKYKIKIMLPSWITAVGNAWRADEPLNVKELESLHQMPPLYGVSVTLTGFARGTYKDEFRHLLSLQGAHVSPNLGNSLTHCIVASPSSPHSQPGQMTQKINSILEKRKQSPVYPAIELVWEGWAREVIAYGGYRENRTKFWEWKEGGIEPIVEAEFLISSEFDGNLDSILAGDSIIECQTSKKLMDIYGNHNGTNVVEVEDDEDIPVPTKAKLRSKQPGNQSVDHLLSSYTSNSILPPGLVKPLQSNVSMGNRPTSKKDSRVERVEMEVEQDNLRIGKKGKSVIRAISTARSTSFAETAAGKRSTISRISRTEEGDGLDDSAYFDNDKNVSNHRNAIASTSKILIVEEEQELRIFNGLKFALMKMGDSEIILKNAIESKGGIVTNSLDNADWICVMAFSSSPEYWNSADPRVVTECWIEQCIFHGKIVEPREEMFDRPSPYQCPVPGVEVIDAHISGYDAVDSTHIRRFLTKTGGNWNDNFSRSRTHLIHLLVDEGKIPTGPKPSRAHQAGIPIYGLKWLKEFVATAACKRDEEQQRDNILVDSKRQASKPLSSGTPWSKSQLAAPARILTGCVIFFAPKLENTSQLLSLAASAGATIAGKFSDQVTHLIHSSNRANESFKEFKLARKSAQFIVHPEWILQSVKDGIKQIEAAFPHLYNPKLSNQLAGIVIPSPPNLSRRNSTKKDTPSPTNTRVEEISVVTVQKEVTAAGIMDSPVPPSAAPVQNLEKQELPNSTNFIASLRASSKSTVKTSNTSQHFDESRNNITRNSPPPDKEDPFADMTVHLSPPPPIFVKTSSPAPVAAKESEVICEVAIAEVPGVPAGTKASLEEKTKELMMQFQPGVRSGENGRRRNRIGRKKSLIEVVPVVISPPKFNTQRRPPGMEFSYSATQDEEESMFITYEDPAGRLARERILAAMNGTTGELQEREAEENEKKREREKEDSQFESVTRKSTRRK